MRFLSWIKYISVIFNYMRCLSWIVHLKTCQLTLARTSIQLFNFSSYIFAIFCLATVLQKLENQIGLKYPEEIIKEFEQRRFDALWESNTSNVKAPVQHKKGKQTVLLHRYPHLNSFHLFYKNFRKRLPKALIIGEIECDTTLIMLMLWYHPSVAVVPYRLRFFERSARYQKGLKWYKNQMPLSSPDQITIENTDNYFSNLEAPARIKTMNESIKLILCVKEPVERMVNQISARSPNAKAARTNLLRVFNGSMLNLTSPFVNHSMYAYYLKNWLAHFNRSQILVVNMDDFSERPRNVLFQVEDFLKIPRFHNRSLQTCLTGECLWNELEMTGIHIPSRHRRYNLTVEPPIKAHLRDLFKKYNDKFYELIGTRYW